MANKGFCLGFPTKNCNHPCGDSGGGLFTEWGVNAIWLSFLPKSWFSGKRPSCKGNRSWSNPPTSMRGRVNMPNMSHSNDLSFQWHPMTSLIKRFWEAWKQLSRASAGKPSSFVELVWVYVNASKHTFLTLCSKIYPPVFLHFYLILYKVSYWFSKSHVYYQKLQKLTFS